MSHEALRQLADRELVGRSAAGDQGAFEVLFERKHRRVYLIAYQVLGDQGAAEDVVQETFLALWNHCGRYRARYSVDAWLRRIATNRAIDRYRVEKRHPKAAAVTEGTAAVGPRAWRAESGFDDPTLADREEADPLHRRQWAEVQALWDQIAGCLSPQQRAAFVLREIEGLPAREVAAAMDCSASTVRSHVSLARKSLRAALPATLRRRRAGSA